LPQTLYTEPEENIMKSAHTSTLPTNIIMLVLLIGSGLSLVVASFAPLRPGASSSRIAQDVPATSSASSKALTTAEAREVYGKIAMSFEANRGQTDASVNFLARGAGYTLFLKPTEAVFQLRSADNQLRNRNQQSTISDQRSKVLRMKLVGADAAAAVAGADELPGKVNYFTGNDPDQWRTDVPTYARVRYSDVYPGIDLVYYGNQRQLEYDFVVEPGRDARAIKLQFAGADKLEVNAAGDLLLSLGEGVILQPKPVVYQEVNGERRVVEGGYALGADGRVAFALGEYDRGLPLVIDPVLVYSTYLGGSDSDQANGIGVDSAGNAYVAGFTASTNFPTANALQAANGGFQDAFITKINAAGTALVYSTYLGGNAQEQSRGFTIDSAGNAYVTGVTGSTNFPTANAVQATKGATNEDAFLTKLNAAGNALVYSTYLGGGDSSEFGQAVAVDSAGNAYVTGVTFSTDFPTVNAIQAAKGGGSVDAFLTKFNAAGNALVYSTYLGGSANDTGFGVAADASGNAYVVGETESTNFPTANALQAANAGLRDAFVAKVNATGSAFIFSTYLGGSGDIDVAQSVAVDSAGLAYVAGQTSSTNFPTANAFQGTNGGTTVTQDAFLTKFNAGGTALVYSTYFGGSGGEIAFGVAVDSSGNAYIAGTTSSLSTLPTANAIQCTRSGNQDVFVAKFNSTASALVYSTYLGGSANDNGRMVAVDSAGNAYVTGMTFSTDFPTVGPIQSTFAGGAGPAGDAFVFKLSDVSAGPASALAFTQTAPVVQEDVTSLTLTVQRTGDTSGAVAVDYGTANGTASERSDYTTALGTLRFAAGETSKTIVVLVNEDSKVEGNETFTVALSNPTGGATLSCPTAVATIQITDDAVEPTTNAIDDSTIFVGQHYHDFLNRQADQAGLDFWVNQIASCAGNADCIRARRANVSTAFFLSIEFQQTGYFVLRTYKSAFGNTPGNPAYRPFLRDTQEIGRGVIIGTPGSGAQLEANKQAFALAFVQRADFQTAHGSQTADQYVDSLFANAGAVPTAAERAAAITAFGAGDNAGRAAALRNIIDSGSVFNKLYNPSFVVMQYFGYLRRNPNDTPDSNFLGYDFWLAKMDSFSTAGEDVRTESVALARVARAQMVEAFIESIEYRARFGP
jgi:hypothetical protein